MHCLTSSYDIWHLKTPNSSYDICHPKCLTLHLIFVHKSTMSNHRITVATLTNPHPWYTCRSSCAEIIFSLCNASQHFAQSLHKFLGIFIPTLRKQSAFAPRLTQRATERLHTVAMVSNLAEAVQAAESEAHNRLVYSMAIGHDSSSHAAAAE